MQEVRFLCLAVSRREGGNCIAGIDIDSHQWLRPVRGGDHAAFADGELVVIDNHARERRFMQPLDLLSIPLVERAETNAQPENWTVAPAFFDNAPEVLRHCTGKRTAELLLSKAEPAGLILHSPGDSLHHEEFAQRPLSHSLSLVRPFDLAWKVCSNTKQPNRVQVRAEFRSGAQAYSLVVTDPVWEARCHRAGLGKHAHHELAGAGLDLVFLAISLAAVGFHGLHYKLVAGVVELPSHGLLT
jgi:hypothetical protein